MDMPTTTRAVFRGSLELLVLALLVNQRLYGYAIQKRIHEASGQMIKAGTLYPLLHDLESRGLIKAIWEEGSAKPRKWYELTLPGRQRLRQSGAAWQGMIARLESLILPAMRAATTGLPQ